MKAVEDRRQAERSRLPMAVRCAVGSADQIEVLLVEASRSGCRIEAKSQAVEVGDQIVMTPQGMQGLDCVVRWVSATGAGLKFATELPEVVLSHLLYDPPEGDDWNFVDGFGRRLPVLKSPG